MSDQPKTSFLDAMGPGDATSIPDDARAERGKPS